jgi:dihydroneopterin aldolase
MADAARAPLDRIHLEDLRLATVVGVHPHERERAREVVLGVTLHADLRPAGESDDLGRTVDYQALEDALAELVGASRDLLIERLAERVAARCLEFAGVRRVDVRLAKPGALPRTGAVAVEISRARGDAHGP